MAKLMAKCSQASWELVLTDQALSPSGSGIKLSLYCGTPSKAQSSGSTASSCCLFSIMHEKQLALADTGSPGSTGWEHLLVALICVKEVCPSLR